MKIEYDPNLVEQTVFLLSRRERKIEAELHAVVDPLYTLPADQERERRFRNAYAVLFSRYGFDETVPFLIGERPRIAASVSECIVREAPRAKAESVELFVRPSDATSQGVHRTLIIQICPPSLLDANRITPLLRRELLHVSDMLDEAFGYDADDFAHTSAERNLLRDRYRVLWDISVEGRLTREGKLDEPAVDWLAKLLARAFAVNDQADARGVVERIMRAESTTHEQLLNGAGHPETILGTDRATPGSPAAAIPAGA